MSSSIDNNKKSENATSTREQYRNQEADLKKRHSKEVSKLQKAYGEKIRQLERSHEEQLRNVREKGNERLNEKDIKYQSEIDKIKQTYSKQNRNTAMEYDRHLRYMQSQHEGEVDKQEQIHDSRMGSLSQNYERDIKNKEASYAKSSDYMRDKQEEGLIHQRDKLERKYMKDGNLLRSEQDKKINSLTSELQRIREQKNSEIKNLKIEGMITAQEDEQNKLDLLMQERRTQEMHKDNLREGFDKNLKGLQEKYHQYNLEAKSGRAEELRNLKTLADVRTRQQVGNLERRITEQNRNNQDQLYDKEQSFRAGRQAYVAQTKEALEVAEDLRSKVYDAANERTAGEIKDITSRHNNVLGRQQQYYQSRIGQMENKYDESINNQVNSLKVENEVDRKKLGYREQKITSILTKEKNDMESYYKELLAEKDQGYKVELSDQRNNLIKERNEAVGQLQARLRETDAKNTDKTNLLIQKYETEIQGLKDQNKQEKKRMTDQFNKRIDELEKSFKFMSESEKVQTQAKEAQLKEQFDRQIATLESKQQEEKIRMAIKK